MQIEHIAMYVNELEKAKDFFVKYFHASANEGYHNRDTDFRSYFLSFDDGARLELMHRPNMVDRQKDLVETGYIH
ncbi:MAG: glyoxalase, partial [Clostridiales bacterium]|nr:glyoxalase [Clostridiales bacterium]